MTRFVSMLLLLGVLTAAAQVNTMPIVTTNPPALAAVTLAWGPSPDAASVRGYAIYWGRAAGSYTNRVDVGNVTLVTLTNVGNPFYAVAVAYDAGGAESVWSNEAGRRVDQEISVRGQALSPDLAVVASWPVAALTNVTGELLYRLAIEQTNRTVTWP